MTNDRSSASLLVANLLKVRVQTLTSLGRIGPHAAEAVPAILELAANEPELEKTIIKSLQQIDPTATETLASE